MSGRKEAATDTAPSEETEMVEKPGQNGTEAPVGAVADGDTEAPRPDGHHPDGQHPDGHYFHHRRLSRMHSQQQPKQLKVSWMQAVLAIVILFLVVIVVVLLGVMFSGHRHSGHDAAANSGVANEELYDDDADFPDALHLRLPKSIVPLHYDLTLQTFFEPDFKFNGKVVIQIVARSSTSEITLHSKDLTIHDSDITVTSVNSSFPDPVVAGSVFDLDRQFLKVRLQENLQNEQHVLLTIPFTGKLREDMKGFYLSEYTSQNDHKM